MANAPMTDLDPEYDPREGEGAVVWAALIAIIMAGFLIFTIGRFL